MSELTWYSRLLIWVGAVILLVESFSGRTLGLVTVVGVLALAGGLLSFVAGLALDGLAAESAGSDVVVRQFNAPIIPLREEESPAAAEDATEPGEPVDASPESLPEPVVPPTRRGAAAVEVGRESVLLGAFCPSCHEPLREGQVAAECRECGTPQHAACWVGNRFRCAREGCGGQGPLEAPEGAGEIPGPSTA